MNNQFMHSDRPALPAAPGAAAQRPPENPLLILRRYLRGRYAVAAALGAVLSVPFALLGYKAIPPVYTSAGIVRVAPTLPKVMYPTEETGMMPMFDSFVSTQAAFLRSRRVIENASNTPELVDAGWPKGTEGLAMLSKAIEVKNPRGSELLHVSVTHKDPRLAQAAVNALLHAYEGVEEELNGTKVQQRETAVQNRVRELQGELDLNRQQILGLTQDFGIDALAAQYETKMKALLQLESQLAEFDQFLALMAPEDPAAGDSPEQEEPLDPLKLAENDAVLKGLLTQEEQARGRLATLESKYTPAHRAVTDARRDLETIQALVKARTALVAKSFPGGGITVAASRREIERRRENMKSLYDKTSQDVKEISRTLADIQARRERSEEIKRDLGEATSRLTQMQVERESIKTGRISVSQKGDYPVAPSTDRRVPLAAFGGLAGFGLGIALVWAYGFFRDGYRYVEELESSAASAPLLGIIPDLTGDDPEQDKQAALSVHHIRNTIQLQAESGPPGRARVFTVTSATSGDGKTHLSLALALSFAMAGRRTLLIDADLIGRALTSQLGLDGAPGLSEAVTAESLNGEVHSARANLWAIPAGNTLDFRPELLSSHLMADLLEKARASFDAVIIDSGPIMGSLEANLASPLSDRVILVVSRGQEPKLVRAALARLRTIGATCAGLVFNRAAAKDFAQSVSIVPTSGRLVASAQRARTPAQTTLTRLMDRETRDQSAPRDA